MLKIFWFVIFVINLNANQNILDVSIHHVRIIEELFFRHNFIYTYHGLKPMSYGVCTKPSDWREVITHKSNYYAWVKLKEYNLNEEYLLLEEASPYSEHDLSVFFIHKGELLRIVNEHLIVFKKYLGSDFDPSIFLRNLELKHTTLRKSIKNNEILLGILLGYGESNSKLFYENCYGLPAHLPRKIQDYESIIVGPEKFPLSLLNPCRCMGTKNNNEILHEKLSKEYVWLSREYASFDSILNVIEGLFRDRSISKLSEGSSMCTTYK